MSPSNLFKPLLLLALAAVSGLGGGPARAAGEAEPGAGSPDRVALWPDGLAPGDKLLPEPMRLVERSADPALPDRYVTHVSEPWLVVYRPRRPNGTALLVIPGGGYQRVVLDKEGSALVPAFVEQGGVTLFVLRYRLPGEGRDDREAALADAQRALRLIRHRAGEWGVDPRRVGTIGFSAGGHLAARLGNGFDQIVHPATDAIDGESARPDFQLLVYPVIDMAGPDAHPGSRDRLLGPHPAPELQRRYSMQAQVRADTPPTFLLHAADDDAVPVGNSLMMFDRLRRAGVDAELHVFPHGGHGFGIRGTAGLTTAAWPRLALDWIAAQAVEATP
ncbi:alpha/beta hydrolase [Stenotrophomonas sp. NLF4-10]|uniref:alpha/beta hydrolase n=1 Tax=Stenotrophomonas sp. NLF4-10 TaxID=2918754 RepID=UPI001EFA8670|nr:alpha/beta hydrolase [Stenotrophomonas sp. NLF4-10]MCG8275040.1 alpha/beta hydrolase [Stenotrophomonas sp. NLF4-10]